MVSTRGMEARIEILERGFEGLLAMKENLEKSLEQERLERLETRRQLNELLNTVRRSVRSAEEESVNEGSQSENEENPDTQVNSRKCEERWRKLEIPVFEGVDAHGWLNRVERYFDLKKMNEAEKLQAVMVAMEGKALSWYQWWEFSAQSPTWEEFRSAVIRRFQPSMLQSPFELLLSLKQIGSVEEYREQFELYAGPLKCTEPSYLKGIFLNGLKEAVRAELKLHPVERLSELMDYAQRIDEKNSLLSKGNMGASSGGRPIRTYNNTRTVTWEPGNKSQSQAVSGAGSSVGEVSHTKPVSSFRGRGFRRLTDAEMQERSKKGLCFRCDEKFSPGHVCSNKQLQVLLLEEDIENETKEENSEEPEPELEMKTLQLSMYSITGLTSKKSIKLWGTLEDKQVVILIDCGASHNFISSLLVKERGMGVNETPPYTVEVGDGRKIPCQGVCSQIKLLIQGLEVQQDFFIFDLGGVDMVLGMEWLSSLGEIRANFRELTLKVPIVGGYHVLKGEPGLARAVVSFKSIIKAINEEGRGFLLEYQNLQAESEANTNLPDWLNSILGEYHEVFQEPTELPPPRRHDHAIILKEGANIPNLRPYRYPHYQKNEIERLVDDMLNSGIIRPSVSPYSSPIILVKKKDGGWRFCVDYRALNKITVPDKFPIPIIDELLDELGGAVIFSKLDLKSGYHQIRMKEEDIPKTAFRTHEGHYEFVVMPFGLTNAPSTFQSLMNEMLKPYLRKFALVFFDDILVYSKTEEDHKRHLRAVLALLKEHQLFANKKKCTFGQTQLEYLGHIISAQGVAADPHKIEVMLGWPTPKDLKALRGFLGLTGYYRRFVKDYGKMARPLTQLLKKDNFQ